MYLTNSYGYNIHPVTEVPLLCQKHSLLPIGTLVQKGIIGGRCGQIVAYNGNTDAENHPYIVLWEEGYFDAYCIGSIVVWHPVDSGGWRRRFTGMWTAILCTREVALPRKLTIYKVSICTAHGSGIPTTFHLAVVPNKDFLVELLRSQKPSGYENLITILNLAPAPDMSKFCTATRQTLDAKVAGTRVGTVTIETQTAWTT